MTGDHDRDLFRIISASIQISPETYQELKLSLWKKIWNTIETYTDAKTDFNTTFQRPSQYFQVEKCRKKLLIGEKSQENHLHLAHDRAQS